jgi:tetratricopeptide (TPR) repeat protein
MQPETENPPVRKVFIVLLCCTAGLLAAYAGYRGYQVWEPSRMLSLARGFIAQGDGKNAILSVREALNSNPRNVEACRLMAELSEAAGSPAVLLWRSRVVELAPGSTDDRLALARAAMSAGDLICATNALAGVSEAGRTTPGFHDIAGGLAAMMGRQEKAEAHFLEASRLQPANPAAQLNLAVLRLHSTNDLALKEARTALRHLQSEPSVRCQAIRELVGDAARFHRTNDALVLSKELAQQTNSLFLDRLLRLDILRMAKAPEFRPALEAFQREAATNAVKTASLAGWEISKLGPADGLVWLQSLPPGFRTNQAVAMLIAECHSLLEHWRDLQAFLQRQNWGDWELIRHAYLARAMRGQDLTSSAKTEWEQALKIASARQGRLVMLLRVAEEWNWLKEGEDLLWTIVNRYPGERWAIRALTQALYVGGRTRSLMSLFDQQAKVHPSDLGIKNNLATAALLLDAREFNPHELAREVFAQAPTNSSFASTYAYSLLIQKKPADALRVMEQLSPAELEKPSICGYYGVILQASGHREKAGRYLDLALKSTLLPEERKLFAAR